MTNKLWNKGHIFDKEIEKFTVGEDYLLDYKLIKYDLYGSIAHTMMLLKINILNKTEYAKLKKGLKNILQLDKKKKFKIALEDEDVHTAVENFLVGKIGIAGKKIHTGRSRNDQVSLDLKLYTKDALLEIETAVLNLCEEMIAFAGKYENTPMPGYTHMQKAMPSSIGLWMCSFIESLLDDLELVKVAYEQNDQNPLGSAAGYGTSIELDREFTTELLGFKKVQNNVLYVQNSRGKIELSVLSALNQVMQTIGKLSTDLLLFTMSEFDYFSLPEELCTGSSIMPQKKNCDCLELLKAKSAMIFGYLMQVNSIISNLPSGYSRNFQLIKKPLFEGIEMALESIDITALVVKNLVVYEDKLASSCTNEIFAAEKAYEFVKKGIPFREAYKNVAEKIGKMEDSDVNKTILSMKTIGNTGNLGLNKLAEKIKKEKKLVLYQDNCFKKKIKNLLK
ncbi:MAG: argininosuccinate lyase [Nanoarchaeota archaeon]|nr:argininosuccinate lyase [Nanoarchaeota archaeon]